MGLVYSENGESMPRPVTDGEVGRFPDEVTPAERAASHYVESLLDDGIDEASIVIDGTVVIVQGAVAYDGRTDNV